MLKRVLCVLTSIALVLAMMPTSVVMATNSGEIVITGSADDGLLLFSWTYIPANDSLEVGYYIYIIDNSTTKTRLVSGERTESTSVVEPYTESGTYTITVSAYTSDGYGIAMADYSVFTGSSSTSSTSSVESITESGVSVENAGYNSEYEGYSYNLSWDAIGEAGGYYVVYSSTLGSGHMYVTDTSTTINGLRIGYTYTIVVHACTGESFSFQGDYVQVVGSATVVVGSSSTPSSSTTNGITVTAVNNASTVISWTANINCASYAVTYTTASGTYNAGITTSTSCTLAIAYSSLKSVTVTGYSSESGTGTATTVGTWTQSSSSSGSTSSGVTATNLGYNASYEAYAYSFSWTAVSNASQYGLNVTSSSGNSNTYTTANTSYSAYLLPGNTYYVTVYAYTGSGNITVGAVAFTVGGSSSTSSGITYTENGYWPYGYFSYTFEWNAFSSDTYIYDIYYNNEYVASTTETSYTDIYIDSGSYVVTVYAKDEEGELLGNVGSVSFMTTPLAITAITVTMPYIIMSNSYMKVFFSWDDIEYASYYEVSYTSSTGEEGTLVVEDCSYQAVLKRGCTYSITIKAYNDRDKMLTEGGLPNWTINSSSSSTTTEAVMCELAGITSDGDDRYAVSYNSYDGATHYQVTAYEVSGTSYVLTDTSDYTTELETTLDLEDGKTYRIYVYAYDPSYYRLGLVGYTDITTDASVAENAEFTFTLPFYGTLSAGDEMIVTLPSSLTTDESVVLPIEYSITLNGVTVKLEGSDGTESGVYEQIVEIGMFARDYFSSEEITVDAMLPELTEVSTTSDIVITASVDCSEYDGAPIISAEDLSSTYGSLMTVAANHIWHEGQFADISSSYVALYPITSSFTGGTITTDLVSATSGLTVTVEASAESGYELSGVMVTDADEASVAVTDCGDGIYTFTMPSSAVTVSADVSHAHSLAKTDAVTETCLTEGNIEYWHCSVCGKYYSDEYATDEITLEDTITPKIAHSYEAVVTNPTCTESGYTTYTCSVCGDSYVADETEATGHSYEAVVTNPTCTEGGYTTYTCSACGDSYVADETEATGHSYEAVVTEPTCTDGGYTTHTCSVCGDSYTDNETTALGHNYEAEVTTEPTCTETGVMTYTCSICGDSYTEDIDMIAHTYGEPEWTWTWSETDQTYTVIAKFTCTVCGGTDTETALVTSETTNATCIATGSIVYTAVVDMNGTSYSYTKTVELPIVPHTEGEAVVENEFKATCTTGGSYDKVVRCTVCNEELSRETITVSATGHTTEIRNAKDAACTEDGYTGDEVCTVCGETITVGTVIPAIGHSFNSEGECSVCGTKAGEYGITSAVKISSGDIIFANVLPSGLVTSVTISISNDNGGTLVVSKIIEDSAYPYLVEHIADTLSFTLYSEAQGDDLISDTNSFTITTTENNKKVLKKVTILFYGDIDYSGTGTSTVKMDFASASDLSSSDIYVLHYTGSYPTWEVVVSTVTFGETLAVEFEASDYSPFVVLSVASASSGGSSSMIDILLKISANYSAVTEAIDRANALNPSDYENFSAVTEAINAVNWNLKAINQLTVNAYADAINTAIDNLVETTANIIEETVEIIDPIEDTNTDTEDDEEEPSEASEPETNPTTGIAFSILPMVIAALAATSVKRR